MKQMCLLVGVLLAAFLRAEMLTDARNIGGDAVLPKNSFQIAHKSCAAPRPCNCDLNKIQCANKGLRAVPPFTEDKLYKHIFLGANNIFQLQDLAFQPLPNLLEIDLLNSKINVISPTAFDSLSKLMKIDLGENQLQLLDSAVFAPLTSVNWLNLGTNQLRNLPNGIFQNNQVLKTLILDHNKFTYFDANVFRPLAGINEIRLDNNPSFLDFPVEVLPNMPHLKTITLTNNRNFYCETLAALGNLVKGANRPGHCVNRPPSTTRNPSISTTPPTTTAWNACPAPKPCTCDFLDAVYCHQKNFLKIPGFRRDESINSLDLSNNHFIQIENNAFANFPNLLRINLGSNGIAQIAPNAFSGLSNLLKLDLSANPLQTLNSQILLGLPSLQTFNFHNVQLRELPSGLFSNNQQLENVFLQNGQLKSLPADLLSPLQSLTYLAIHNNPDITDFPLEVLPNLPKLSHINLGNNKQFSCETLRVLQRKLQKVDGPGHCVNHPSPSPPPTTAGSTTPHAVVTFPPPPTISDKCKNQNSLGQSECMPANTPQNACQSKGCCFIDYGIMTFCFYPAMSLK